MTRFGGYAEYAKTKIKGIIEIPKEISNGAALALATQYCTAYFALCHVIKLYLVSSSLNYMHQEV